MQSSHRQTRADAARQALAAHSSDASEELGACISDLVTDLGHLCDAENLDFVKAIQRAFATGRSSASIPTASSKAPSSKSTSAPKGFRPNRKPVKRPDKRKNPGQPELTQLPINHLPRKLPHAQRQIT